MASVAVPNLLNGFASGFIFVPLTTMTMGRLRKEEMGNAAGIYNLVRNMGGSVGIASVTTFLVRGAQVHQNYLVAHVTPGAPALTARLQGLQARLVAGGLDLAAAQHRAVALVYHTVRQQASLMAYLDNFRLLGGLALLCLPLALLFQQVRRRSQGAPEAGGNSRKSGRWGWSGDPSRCLTASGRP